MSSTGVTRMRNQKPFTKQRIFDKAPGESANPVKRVKSLIEKTLRSHLGNGWTYLNQSYDADGLLNSISETQITLEQTIKTKSYFYFKTTTGVLVESITELFKTSVIGESFKIHICAKEVIQTRAGQQSLEKTYFIVNFTKTETNNYKVTSVWDAQRSPVKFEPSVVSKFVKEVFIPTNEHRLDSEDLRLIADAVRFWHTL